jgi:hypothetical protein
MADGTYTPLVYMAQGGSQQVVASGGSVKIETGGKLLPDSGTQASHIANATGGTYSTGVQAKINSILVALEGVGILATS